MAGAVLYLKIYSFGMPAMALYNCGNGILSAYGDTKRPLIYLSISGILNVILNLFFVIICHMAAEGVACASVIAQYLSASLIVIHLLRRKDELKNYDFIKMPVNQYLFLVFQQVYKIQYLQLLTCLYRSVSIHLIQLLYQVILPHLMPML